MDSRNYVLKESAMVLIGEVVCSAAMVGIFALLGDFGKPVVLGAAVGSAAAVLNFFFMAVSAMMAADKAEKQDVKGGQVLVRVSYLVRMVVLFLVLFAFARSGLCNVIALVLPLAFVRPIITIGEFFRKPGESNA